MPKEPVHYESRDRAGYLTLNRPQALNAIDEGVLASLAEILPTLAADESVKALVVTGAGDAFCVGLDLGLLTRAFDDLEYFRDVLVRLKGLLLQIEALPVPVIAAVNGLARAGGFELALACDLIFVAEEARIGDTHLAYGISPGGGATQRLPRLVGRQRARELIFSGRWMSGREAVEFGLALASFPRAALPFAVEETVATYRRLSRPALAATKSVMESSLERGLDDEIDTLIRYLKEEPTAREGLRASIERREHVWP